MSVAARDRRSGGQRVVDPEHHCDFVPVPFLLLDDIARERLHPTAAVLWMYYKRRAWETHGKDLPPAEALRDTEKRSGLGRGTILTQRQALADAGWLELDVKGDGRGQTVTVKLLNRWDENCHGHTPRDVQILDKAAPFVQIPDAFVQNLDDYGRRLDKAHLASARKTLEDIEDPWGASDRSTRVGAIEPQLPGMLTEVVRPQFATADLPVTDSAYSPEDLLSGLYRDGLSSEPVRDGRELDSARALVARGATPADAAAWARQAVMEGIQFITATTFLKAWPGWRVRRCGQAAIARPSGYEHDPWQGKRPPVAEAELARGGVL